MTAGFAYLGWRQYITTHYSERNGSNNNSSNNLGSHLEGTLVTAFVTIQQWWAALNNRTCKEKHFMHMLRVLFFIKAHHEFKIAATHVSGASNTLADHLSKNQLELFQSLHKTAQSKPSYVDPSLLQWLLYSQQDWTSPAWTQRFNSFSGGYRVFSFVTCV